MHGEEYTGEVISFKSWPRGENESSDTPKFHIEDSQYKFRDNSGETAVDVEIKDYLDAKIETVRAQNDARFAELRSDISSLITKIDHLPTPLTFWQFVVGLGSAVVAALGIVLAVLAYGSDRFDSGVSAMGAIEEALDAQRETNAMQDVRLDRILQALEAENPPE